MNNSSIKNNPMKHKPFFYMVILLFILMLALTLTSLIYGSASISLMHVWQAIIGVSAHQSDVDVIWQLRLPRTLLALIVGVHFALSGVILQTIIRNPLADPGIMGVSSGAGFAIVVTLLLADWLSATFSLTATFSLQWLPLAAVVGGFTVALLVLFLTKSSGFSPARLALNGIALAAIFQGAVIWIVVVWGGGRTETTLLWLSGSLYGRDFSHLGLILPWSLVALIGIAVLYSPLKLLRFNDITATALGLNVSYWRLCAILLAVLLAASAIAVSGPVGFLGLIVPHIARLIVGNNLLKLLVVSALLGASLMLVADIICRLALSPRELPAGILTTLIGIPFLLFILQSRGKKAC